MRKIKLLLLVFGCMVAALETRAELPIEAAPADTMSYIITIDANSPIPTLSEDEINARAVQITYRLNRTEIRTNDKGYQRLLNDLKRFNRNKNYVCRMIVIQGGASPEGPLAHNRWLGDRRAHALVDSIARYIDIDPQSVKITNIVEDYAMLYTLVKKNRDPYRSVVLKTIDQYRGHLPAMKRALRSIKGGTVWTALYRKYFPQLRSARAVLFVSEKEEPKAPVQPDVSPEPNEEVPPVSDSEPQPKPEPAPVPTPQPVPSKSDSIWIEVRQPMLSVRTNVLYDLLFFMPNYGWAPTPNVAVEFYPKKGHFTFGAQVTHPGWRNDNKNKTWIIHDYMLETRYYLQGNAAFVGHYFQLYGHTGRYDIQFSPTKAWLGDELKYNWGFGLGWGWAKRLGKESRWKIQANAAIGFFHTRFDEYHPAESWVTDGGDFFYNWHKDPAKFVKKRKSFSWQGPTQIGFSISYDLIDYPHKHFKVRKEDVK